MFINLCESILRSYGLRTLDAEMAHFPEPIPPVTAATGPVPEGLSASHRAPGTHIHMQAKHPYTK